MAEYLIQGETLDAIADAINAKTGGTSAMTPAEMVTAIGNISGGGAVEHHQFIHAEDWFTDSVGNASAFYNTYLAQLYANKNSGFGAAIISNNTATRYAAAYTFRDFNIINKTSWMRSSGSSTAVMDTGSASISFYVSAGSIIDVYIIQEVAAT